MESHRSLTETIFSHFSLIPDPRAKNIVHPLETILFVLVVGTLCGGDGFVQIEQIAKCKEGMLRRYVNLDAGIPTHDTLSRFLQALTPKVFGQVFADFMAELTGTSVDDILSIDGKTLRGVASKRDSKQAEAEDQVHMVNAFSHTRNVVLGQLRTVGGANEIKGARELLMLLDIKGALITADCLHCHGETFSVISEQGAEAVIGLKKNQPKTRNAVEEAFAQNREAPRLIETVEKGHGRIETRTYEAMAATGISLLAKRFPTVQSVFRVVRERDVVADKKGLSEKVHYYLSTLPVERTARSVEAIRAHWGIENSVHFILDTAFDEDHSRVRTKYAAENLSRIRQLVLSLLHLHRTDPKDKNGMKTRRLIALANDSFLVDVLQLLKRNHLE